MLERSDVKLPMWRKKVDRSLLHYGITPLPGWVCAMWNLPTSFADVFSKTDARSSVSIVVDQGILRGCGNVHQLKTPGNPYRLALDKNLTKWLRRQFPMSYIRAVEIVLKGGRQHEKEVEANPAFWEFLDIEYDESQKVFLFTAHYRQSPVFPEFVSISADDDLIDRIGGNSNESAEVND